jgi:hypothetical protein
MGFLAHAFPQMVQSYGRLYAGAYAAPAYVKEVRAVIEMFKARHGMTGNNRYEDAEPDEAPAPSAPEQAPLEFQDTEISAWRRRTSTSGPARSSRTDRTS